MHSEQLYKNEWIPFNANKDLIITFVLMNLTVQLKLKERKLVK